MLLLLVLALGDQLALRQALLVLALAPRYVALLPRHLRAVVRSRFDCGSHNLADHIHIFLTVHFYDLVLGLLVLDQRRGLLLVLCESGTHCGFIVVLTLGERFSRNVV